MANFIYKYYKQKESNTSRGTISNGGSISIPSYSNDSNNAQSSDNAKTADEALKLTYERELWGNKFDGSQDVSGTLKYVDSIEFSIPQSDFVPILSFENGNMVINTALETDKSYRLKGDNNKYFTLSYDYPNVKFNGADGSYIFDKPIKSPQINSPIISGDTLEISAIEIDGEAILTSNGGNLNVSYGLEVDGGINADEITALNINADDGNIKNIVCDNIQVNGSLKTFNIEVDEVKSIGGQVILSPGHAIVSAVEDLPSENAYSLSWEFRDKDGNVIDAMNQFQVGDQILCHTFDIPNNRYYWALCTEVDTLAKLSPTDEKYQDILEKHNARYILISKNDYIGNAIPKVGDEIVVLGNRTIANRQNAIVLCTNGTPYNDNDIESPAIIQYEGISSFNLSSYKKTYLSKNENVFKGNFFTEDGSSIEDKFASLSVNINGIQTMVSSHTASITSLNNSVSTITQKADSIESSVSGLYGKSILIGKFFENTTLTNGKYNLNPQAQQWRYISKAIKFPYIGDYYLQYQFEGMPSDAYVTIKLSGSTSETTILSNTDKQTPNENTLVQFNISDATIDYKFVMDVWNCSGYSLTMTNPTIFPYNGSVSLIKQTADQILLRVEDVALKVDNKQVTIDGNTQFNGNVVVNDGGLSLISESGKTEVISKSVGANEAFINEVNDTTHYHLSCTSTADKKVDGGATLSSKFSCNIGRMKQGTNIVVSNIIYSAGIPHQPSTIILRIYKANNGTILEEKQFTNVVDNPILTDFTITETDNYAVSFICYSPCDAKYASSSNLTLTSGNTNLIARPLEIYSNIQFDVSVPRNDGDTYGLLGADGISFVFGQANKYMHVSMDGFYIQYGSTKFKITSDGVFVNDIQL